MDVVPGRTFAIWHWL